jgi:hypothetical protein
VLPSGCFECETSEIQRLLSPSLSEGVMEKSWVSEVQARSQLSSIPNFPITMEISKFPPRRLALEFTFHVPRLGF